MTKHLFWFSGITGVIVYFFATIYGGVLFTNYSHLTQHISELLGSHATTRTLLNPLYLLYNLLLITFAFGVYKQWDNRKTKLGAVSLVITGLASILMWWFPVDTRGYPLTRQGEIHIILAALESFSTLIATFFIGFGLRKNEYLLSKISFITGFLILITGPLAGITTVMNSPFLGLFERITIGIFHLWILIFSISMARKE